LLFNLEGFYYRIFNIWLAGVVEGEGNSSSKKNLNSGSSNSRYRDGHFSSRNSVNSDGSRNSEDSDGFLPHNAAAFDSTKGGASYIGRK